jgi:hypothetical protein
MQPRAPRRTKPGPNPYCLLLAVAFTLVPDATSLHVAEPPSPILFAPFFLGVIAIVVIPLLAMAAKWSERVWTTIPLFIFAYCFFGQFRTAGLIAFGIGAILAAD